MLHNQVELSLGVYGIMEHDNILMVHLLKNLDFSDCASLPLYVHKLVLVVDLNRQALAGLLMHSFLNDSIGSLAEGFAHSVLCNACEIESPELGYRSWQQFIRHCVLIMVQQNLRDLLLDVLV